ncbi:MAG TPA: hypothetical protein VIY86_06480 [Pirellulaceae bacterium]
MIARRSVWPQPEVQELARRFVTAADEVYRLQSGQEAECRMFQSIAEQGHYGGRERPSSTRQGIYAMTAGGQFLASVNSNDPRVVAEMLRQAWRRWQDLSPDERSRPAITRRPDSKVPRADQLYPINGLVLHVYSRDLPREQAPSDWRGRSWNQDFAWFRAEEAATLVPSDSHQGAEAAVPEALIRRLARLHLVDNVRGQTDFFAEQDVKQASLASKVTAVTGDLVSLEYRGNTHTQAEGRWPVAGFRQGIADEPQKRGYIAEWLGTATFDRRQRRFVAFELVVLGDRWGGTQFNGRADDLDPHPMGIAFTLAKDIPAERVAPAFIYAYGW